jgi:hypothetical protein
LILLEPTLLQARPDFYYATLIAKTGVPIDGRIVDAFLGCPSINGRGEIIFAGVLDDGTQAIFSTETGFVVSEGREVDSVPITGDVALGCAPQLSHLGDIVFRGEVGASLDAVLAQYGLIATEGDTVDGNIVGTLIDDGSKIAYLADLSGRTGLVVNDTLTLAVDDTLETRTIIELSSVALNNSGTVVCKAAITDPDDKAIVTPDAIISHDGTAQPSGRVFGASGLTLSQPMINEAGTIVYHAESDAVFGIFTNDATTPSLGDTVTGENAIIDGRTLMDASAAYPSINDAGQIVFHARYNQVFDDDGIFVAKPTGLIPAYASHYVAQTRMTVGGDIVEAITSRPVISNAGEVVFFAELFPGGHGIVRSTPYNNLLTRSTPAQELTSLKPWKLFIAHPPDRTTRAHLPDGSGGRPRQRDLLPSRLSSQSPRLWPGQRRPVSRDAVHRRRDAEVRPQWPLDSRPDHRYPPRRGEPPCGPGSYSGGRRSRTDRSRCRSSERRRRGRGGDLRCRLHVGYDVRTGFYRAVGNPRPQHPGLLTTGRSGLSFRR